MKITPRFLLVLFLLLAIAVGLYSWLVWPTAYFIVDDPEYGVIRVNRSTGVFQRATDHGWMTQEEVETSNKAKLAPKPTPTPRQ